MSSEYPRSQPQLLFHNITSSQSEPNGVEEPQWITEVLHIESEAFSGHPDPDIPIPSKNGPAQSSGASNENGPKVTSERSTYKSNVPKGVISFVNVSGAPTKESRKQARKSTTAEKKLEKKERRVKEERQKILALLTGRSSNPEGHGELSGISVAPAPPVFELLSFSRVLTARGDPFMISPFELSYREKKLLDHIFYVESAALKPYKAVFFPLGLTDVAAFHQILANLAIQLSDHRPPGQGAIEYEKHEVETRHAAALRIIQKRLPNPEEATSEGTIATIIAMICYSHSKRDFNAWQSHIKGLQEILKLQKKIHPTEASKSGILGLDNRILGSSLSWVDVNGSATQGKQPCLPLQQYLMPATDTEAKPHRTAVFITRSLESLFPSGETIFRLFYETATLAEKLKAELLVAGQNVYGDGAWCWNNIYPLAHKVYSYRAPLDIDDEASIVKECCRLSLCIFLTHVRAEFGMSPASLDIYVDQLLPLLGDKGFQLPYGEVFQGFRLWVLAMGAMEGRGETRIEVIKILKGELDVAGITTHIDLEAKLMEIIWVGRVNGKRFWELYKELWKPCGSREKEYALRLGNHDE
ncbi:fungal-specific transcription factor domain-containing protein [Bisporella sp. PMI_857]|nr:fungal-specific transcription factor domain-containing protein [Bisporella sp. PMI_857]